MTEERHNERDSQLSAMFDGELPGGECELLARRLAKDDSLRAQWSRYSLIGAALRAERGVVLHDRVALRVQAAIAREAAYGDAADAPRPAAMAADRVAARRAWSRFGTPLAGASIAASVAAVSIFWLRGAQEPVGEVLADNHTPTMVVLAPDAGTPVAVNSAERVAPEDAGLYSTPAPNSATSIAPPARLANYVVAHSEYSGPLTRRMALLGIVGAEAGEPATAPDVTPTSEDVDAP